MKHAPALFLLTSLVAGCAHEAGLPDFYADETQARFGEAVRQNIAAQTVNPDAPREAMPEASAARTALAQERYAEDKVEKPSATSTLRVKQGNSGNSDQ